VIYVIHYLEDHYTQLYNIEQIASAYIVMRKFNVFIIDCIYSFKCDTASAHFIVHQMQTTIYVNKL